MITTMMNYQTYH